MKNITDELLLIVCIASVVGMKVIYDTEGNKEVKNYNCNVIKEASEYPVEELTEAGCMTENYLLTL